MKRVFPPFILAALLGVSSCVPGPAPVPNTVSAPENSGCQVIHVVDGDTVDMTCPGEGRFRARLTGFDTPESYEPGCHAEAEAARAATSRLRALVRASNNVGADLGGLDRYNRRLVTLMLDGQDVGTTLISEGLAVAYRGGHRINWCARLS